MKQRKPPQRTGKMYWAQLPPNLDIAFREEARLQDREFPSAIRFIIREYLEGRGSPRPVMVPPEVPVHIGRPPGAKDKKKHRPYPASRKPRVLQKPGSEQAKET